MWRNFGYGGFGSYGEQLANRGGERELLQEPFMANRDRRGRGRRVAEESEAGGELGRRRGRLGDDTGRENGIGFHDGNAQQGASGGLASITAAVAHREKYGRGGERLTCGGHV